MGTKKAFSIMLKNDMANLFFYMLFIVFIAGILYGLLTPDVSGLDIYFFIAIAFSGGTIQSGGESDFYLYFIPCRKKLFKYQSVLVLFRAAVVAVIYTGIRYAFYPQYVASYLEDSEKTIAMYHRIPVIELFIFHWLCFVLLFFYFLISNTMIYSLVSMSVEKTAIVQERRMKRKQKNRVYQMAVRTGMVVFEFILLVAAGVTMMGIYDSLLTHEFSWRCQCILVVLVMDFILYGIAKHRYSPKYL